MMIRERLGMVNHTLDLVVEKLRKPFLSTRTYMLQDKNQIYQLYIFL